MFAFCRGLLGSSFRVPGAAPWAAITITRMKMAASCLVKLWVFIDDGFPLERGRNLPLEITRTGDSGQMNILYACTPSIGPMIAQMLPIT